jgi:PHD/YefM family antitoxin component YafN of YafNO toxin-antitoxin module
MLQYTMTPCRGKLYFYEPLAYKGEGDTVIERNGQPVAALIPFEDYEALLDELDDLRAGRRAQAALEAWEKDRSLGRPYEEVRAEMVRDGMLDA